MSASEYRENSSAKLAGRLEKQIAGIKRILTINSYGLLSPETKKALNALRERAEALVRKLKSGEYEVAIVGLEKAGKSTFANALMGNDILPTKEERCTYTATSIRWAEEDHAEVAFFTPERFTADFQANLKKMGIPHADSLTPATITLEEYRREFKKLEPEKQSYYSLSVNRDIETILTHYETSLKRYIGAPPRRFDGRETLTGSDFKRFIEAPECAIAVSEITLYSNKLDKMRNAVIYDVPGFDSPTEMHKAQTKEKMIRADAILFVTSAFKPSLTGPSLDMFRIVKDDDGILLRDKTFVFANMSDRAEKLATNLEIMKNELEGADIMLPEHFDRIVAGSAKGALQAAGVLDGQDVLDTLRAKGLTDGISEIHDRLTEYNRNERARVLAQRAGKVESDIRNLFAGLFETEEQATTSWGENAKLIMSKSASARVEIRRRLEDYRSQLIEKFSEDNHPLTDRLLSEVVANIQSADLGVTDEELNRAIKSVDVSTQSTLKVDFDLREAKRPQIYNAFQNGVIQLAVNEHKACDSEIEDIFLQGMGVTEENSGYAELRRSLQQYIERVRGKISSEGYYDSLVFRFSDNVFDILLQFTFGDDDRFENFVKNRDIFYSLAMFDRNFNPALTPEEQPLIYKLLFHESDGTGNHSRRSAVQEALDMARAYVGGDFSENTEQLIRAYARKKGEKALSNLRGIIDAVEAKTNPALLSDSRNRDSKLSRMLEMEVDVNEELPPDSKAGNVAPSANAAPHDEAWYRSHFQGRRLRESYEAVREEINEDIDALHDVLESAIVRAVCIEKPFLAMQRNLIRDLLLDVEQGEKFQNFFSDNFQLIAAEECRDLSKREQQRNIRRAIRAEISGILEAMNSDTDKV